MISEELFIIGVIGVIVWAFALYLIIQAANKTLTRDKIQLQNQDLLALIAEKLGVDVDRINSVISKKK